MTWSGKTRAKNAQKIALKDFKNTVTLITKILQAADNKLDEMSCQKAITYKVLKYFRSQYKRCNKCHTESATTNNDGANGTTTHSIISTIAKFSTIPSISKLAKCPFQ